MHGFVKKLLLCEDVSSDQFSIQSAHLIQSSAVLPLNKQRKEISSVLGLQFKVGMFYPDSWVFFCTFKNIRAGFIAVLFYLFCFTYAELNHELYNIYKMSDITDTE